MFTLEDNYNFSLNKLECESNIILFFSILKCVKYLRSKGYPVTQTTLVKYIDTGKSYHRYIFKYV